MGLLRRRLALIFLLIFSGKKYENSGLIGVQYSPVKRNFFVGSGLMPQWDHMKGKNLSGILR